MFIFQSKHTEKVFCFVIVPDPLFHFIDYSNKEKYTHPPTRNIYDTYSVNNSIGRQRYWKVSTNQELYPRLLFILSLSRRGRGSSKKSVREPPCWFACQAVLKGTKPQRAYRRAMQIDIVLLYTLLFSDLCAFHENAINKRKAASPFANLHFIRPVCTDRLAPVSLRQSPNMIRLLPNWPPEQAVWGWGSGKAFWKRPQRAFYNCISMYAVYFSRHFSNKNIWRFNHLGTMGHDRGFAGEARGWRFSSLLLQSSNFILSKNV